MSLKQEYAIKNGFDYKIYVFNRDGTTNKII